VINVKKLIFDPGYRLVYLHRLTALLYDSRFLRPFSYLVWQFEIIISSCHISPRCKLHPTLEFPHPTGIVIGDGVVMDEGVVIYQNVTIGVARRGRITYPRIGKGVVIYAGAVIVGAAEIKDNDVVPANHFINGDIKGRDMSQAG